MLSQAYWASLVSGRSAGNSSQVSASLLIAGASNKTEAAEVSAVPERALGDHLPQDAEHLDAQLVDGGEAVGGVGRRTP